MDKIYIEIPGICPSCGKPTQIRKDGVAEVLYCTNEYCACKMLAKLKHYVHREAMNIEGLSIQTLTMLYDLGVVKIFSDIYGIEKYKDKIANQPGFGINKWNNLIEAINKSKENVEPYRLIYGLSIDSVGVTIAKHIMNHYQGDFNAFIQNKGVDLDIPGIGESVSGKVNTWLNNRNNVEELNRLLSIIDFKKETYFSPSNASGILAGKSFCITGGLEILENRKAFEKLVEENGGKNASGVSKGLSYLVTNDTTSGSSKNKKAQELNIPIITEKQFLDMLKQSPAPNKVEEPKPVVTEDKSKEIVESIVSKLKSEGNGWQKDEVRQLNDGSWEQGVRDAFHWEVPEDCEDSDAEEEDYDWKSLTSSSCKKIDSIIEQYKTKYPNYQISWSQEEKCWISVNVKKTGELTQDIEKGGKPENKVDKHSQDIFNLTSQILYS